MLQSLEKFNLSSSHVNALEMYSLLMQKWNERIQMTATRDLGEFISRHVADSLELASELPDAEASMIDVGSGGGLPGIVLAIVCPQMQFTLIEPTKKKQAFLAAAKRELKLTNLQSFALRDEEFLVRPDFQAFDFAVARAVWSLELWLPRALPLVRPGGIIFGMEGREESPLPPGAERRRYELADDRRRSIVRWTRPGNPGEPGAAQ